MVFLSPAFLWLLLLLPAFLARRTRGARGTLILALRLALVALLVLCLSEPALRKRSDAVTTFFLLDRSGSIPAPVRAWSLDVVRQAAAKRARPEDRAGLIVFGGEATVEESPTPHFQVDQVFSVVEAGNTDLAAAVRLALSSFPEDTQRRIVLFSDGNETRGDARAAARQAAAAGVPVDVVPLKYRHAQEAVLESLSLPRKVRRDEPFQVRASVGSVAGGPGTLRILCDGQLVAEREVSLRPGDNVFVFSHALREGGFHRFEAEVRAAGDGIAENNRAQAYTIIEEESVVLLAAGAAADAEPLAAALREEGIALRVRTAADLPRDLAEWQGYDAVVFANLGADHVGMARMEMLESLVRDLGTGFVMIGGPQSFGAGGYLGTPVERILPVGLNVDQTQVLPNGGIAFVLDHVHCIGDRWTKDICVGTLNGLTPFDGFGVIAGGGGGWAVPLDAAHDKPGLRRTINAMTVGDVENVDAYLDRVRQAFGASRYSTRHTVLVTDGRGPVVPGAGAVRRLREAGITMSVVVIEPRAGQVRELEAAARAGGGNFHVVEPHEYHRVPQIFLRESTVVKKGLYFEERFVPSARGGSEILEGIGAGELPALRGCNVTSPKGGAVEVPLTGPHGDAVLAQGRSGLGKVVAFTSDASARWAPDWVAWSKYRRFWAQALRWAQRRTTPSPYQLTLERGRKDGTCEAVIDAQDAEGNTVNFLAPQGIRVGPDLQPEPLRFEQSGPGRYRASFPADKPGGYVVNVQYVQDGKPWLMRGGYVPPFAAEYRRFEDDEALLLALADQTGGRAAKPGTDFFAPTGTVAYTMRPLAPLLLLLAVCLLPLDIFVRRVVVTGRDLGAFARALVPWRRRGRDAAGEALALERESIRARHWTGTGAEERVEAEAAPVGAGRREAALPEDLEIAVRLREAKKRAQRKMERS